MTDEPIYTEDRVKRIRTVLWIVVGVGALLALLAAYTLVVLVPGSRADENYTPFSLVVAVVAVAVVGSSALSMRLLGGPRKQAKVALAGTGGALILSGILLSSAVIGYFLPLLGLAILFLALLTDGDPA